MKYQISTVRIIVPNHSNNDIILVFQHLDNCIDQAVQSLMEGGANAVLT